LVADTAESISWKATIESLVRVTAFYWATLLFYCRMIGDTGIDAELRRNALAKLTNTLYVHHKRDNEKRRKARIVWPTFIAAIATRDPIHRSWLIERLREYRNLTSECSRLCSTAEEILSLQGTPDSPRVDLAGYMKSQLKLHRKDDIM